MPRCAALGATRLAYATWIEQVKRVRLQCDFVAVVRELTVIASKDPEQMRMTKRAKPRARWMGRQRLEAEPPAFFAIEIKCLALI